MITVDQQLAFLEHFPEHDKPPHRIAIGRDAFRIGRNPLAHFVIYSTKVSKEHAEIFWADGGYRIRDLGSRNGTHVNGKRIQGPTPLANGDIIHVAHAEFRFAVDGPGTNEGHTKTTDPVDTSLPSSLIRGGEQLREMLTEHGVVTLFQPIVNLETSKVFGYEALGRGNHSELSTTPTELFRLADRCHMAAELSRTFRLAALEQVGLLPKGVYVFFNVHPAEMNDPGLFDSLREMRLALGNGRQMVVEMHENSVSDVVAMRKLHDRLTRAEIRLAFDDFGVGQSRFLELTEAPPDFVKLDRGLIRDIDRTPARQELVRAMNRLIRKFGVQIVAEGVEREQEARTCERLGCHFGQGHHFGRPAAATAHAAWSMLA